MGVNEARHNPDFWYRNYVMDSIASTEALTSLARQVWHPVSELPTEEDGDEHGYVLTQAHDGTIQRHHWMQVPDLHKLIEAVHVLQWARIRDVVLLPPEGE